MRPKASEMKPFRPYHPGELLKEELECRNIKQKDFAKQVDRTERTIRRWMYEGITLLSDIELVVAALEVSIWDILSDNEEDVPSFLTANGKRSRPMPTIKE